MNIHYFKNLKGLPAAILAMDETSETALIPAFHPSYEVEIPTGHIPLATGYLRAQTEVETWSPASRETLVRFEQGLSRLYPGLAPCFWSTFVDQMAHEIEQRMQLHKEWMNKLREQHQRQQPAITPPQNGSSSEQELA